MTSPISTERQTEWDGHPTPAEAAFLLRKHADQKGLPPNDNDYADAASVIDKLVSLLRASEAELLAAREALTAADYYIDRLQTSQRRVVVRDLDEARVGYEVAKARALSGNRSGK